MASQKSTALRNHTLQLCGVLFLLMYFSTAMALPITAATKAAGNTGLFQRSNNNIAWRGQLQSYADAGRRGDVTAGSRPAEGRTEFIHQSNHRYLGVTILAAVSGFNMARWVGSFLRRSRLVMPAMYHLP